MTVHWHDLRRQTPTRVDMIARFSMYNDQRSAMLTLLDMPEDVLLLVIRLLADEPADGDLQDVLNIRQASIPERIHFES